MLSNPRGTRSQGSPVIRLEEEKERYAAADTGNAAGFASPKEQVPLVGNCV